MIFNVYFRTLNISFKTKNYYYYFDRYNPGERVAFLELEIYII